MAMTIPSMTNEPTDSHNDCAVTFVVTFVLIAVLRLQFHTLLDPLSQVRLRHSCADGEAVQCNLSSVYRSELIPPFENLDFVCSCHTVPFLLPTGPFDLWTTTQCSEIENHSDVLQHRLLTLLVASFE